MVGGIDGAGVRCAKPLASRRGVLFDMFVCMRPADFIEVLLVFVALLGVGKTTLRPNLLRCSDVQPVHGRWTYYRGNEVSLATYSWRYLRGVHSSLYYIH